MCFWNKLLDLEKHLRKCGQLPPKRNPTSLPSPTRPAPPMPECKPLKASVEAISEPVLSILQSLKDGEWSHQFLSAHGWPYLEFTHEWFGNKLYLRDTKSCDSMWMTQAEKEAVGYVCWQIYQGRVNFEKEQSLAKQRESFMCFVKEK